MKCIAFFLILKMLLSTQVATAQQDAIYDSLISRGNIAITEKKYPLAKSFFREALAMKPSDPSYPLFQIHLADSLLRAQADSNPAGIQQRFEDAMTAYENYEKVAQTADYEGELLYLKQFLNFIPDSSQLNPGQAHNGTKKIHDAQDKIKALRDALSRTKGSFYQAEAMPYTNLELDKKFPKINVADIRAHQVFELSDATILSGIDSASEKILTERADSISSDSAANIKLICQSIKVKDDNMYLRLCIRNYSTYDFVTGPMQLTLVKKDKNLTTLRPVYISNLPIILPNKEFFIVFVTKTTKVNKGDKLIFEVNELLQKQKFRIHIPTAEFNQVKSM